MEALVIRPVETSFSGGTLEPGQGFLLRFDRPLGNDDWDALLETLGEMFLDLVDDAAYGEAAPDLVYVIREDMADARADELAGVAAAAALSVGVGCEALTIARVDGDTLIARISV